jgi:DNA-binding transcriptional regulator YbjK
MSNAQRLEELKTQKAKIEEALRVKKAKIAKQISLLKTRGQVAERKADAHVKNAIGGAVLEIVRGKGELSVHSIFQKADGGVQPQGLGREKFNALRAALVQP